MGEVPPTAESVSPHDPLLRRIVEALPIASIALDRAGCVALWNAAAERLTGWSLAEVFGRRAPFVADDRWDEFVAMHRQGFVGGPMPDLVVRRVRKDGSAIVVQLTRSLLRDVRGEPIAILGQLVDITAQTLATDARARNEASLREFIEHAPEAMVVHRNLHVVFANRRFTALLRYADPEQLVGKPILSLVHPDYHDVVGERLREISAGAQGNPPLRQRLVRADEREVHVEVTGFPILFDGLPSAVGHVRDLTQTFELEAQLRAADRLASVGRLAAVVGHEINNPLAYVVGNLEALRDRLGRESELRTNVDAALEGAERVRRIVHDLKVFSRSEGERQIAVDVRRVLDSCARMAQNEIRHRAELVTKYDDDLPLVIGDEARLGQVFLNLLVNAAQAIPEVSAGKQHRVSITARRGEGATVIVEVTDTGVGIDEALLSRVFEPFFAVKRPGKAGSGVGLSICKSLLESHGGSIAVESKRGRGTTMRVTLPQAKVDEEPSSTRGEAEPELHARILIVDDEPRLAVILRSLLHQHEVVVAGSGREALAQLAKGPFDVVLCDLMMPEMSGIELYQAIGERFPGLEKKVVFMTGGAFTTRATEFLGRIRNPCLEKPFKFAELSATIDRVLRHSLKDLPLKDPSLKE